MTDSPSKRVQFLLRIEEDLLDKIREEATLHKVSVSEIRPEGLSNAPEVFLMENNYG